MLGRSSKKKYKTNEFWPSTTFSNPNDNFKGM